MSDSLGLVDFAIGLVIIVLNLPDGQVLLVGEIVINPANQKGFLGLVEMTRGLVDASYSLPKWQAVKLTFFAPWSHTKIVRTLPLDVFLTASGPSLHPLNLVYHS